MQTAPPGTYSGMVQCATGILKNEGPLAFYKVGSLLVGIQPKKPPSIGGGTSQLAPQKNFF